MSCCVLMSIPPHSAPTQEISINLSDLISNNNEGEGARFILTAAPRDESVRSSIERIFEQANFFRRQSRRFKCRFIIYLFSVLCWVCTVCDVLLTGYLATLKRDVLISETHGRFEIPLLVIVALFAVALLTFTTQVIIREIHIHPRYYFICLALMVTIIIYNASWIFKEQSHRHVFKNSTVAIETTAKRITDHFELYGENSIPSWVDRLQEESMCCGIENVNDWKKFWHKPDVPDSCCIEIFDGCGKNILSKIHSQSPLQLNIHFTGCLRNPYTFNFVDLILLEQVKFLEAVFMIFSALLWLCRWDSILSPNEPLNIILRCILQPENQGEREAQPLNRRTDETDRNTDNDLLANNIANHHELPTDSNHRLQRGGGDIAETQSVQQLTSPKTRDNFQHGDYKEIDPTHCNDNNNCHQERTNILTVR